MRITLTLAMVAAAAVFVAANSTRQAGAGVISGRVVDVLSGQAVPNATVVFSSDGGRSRLATAVSDSDGRFVFREVPATELGWLWARMPGYLDGYYGQRFPVLDGRFRPFEFAQGERIEDATIKLWKEAVVHGRVLDAAGNATAGVTVMALKEIALGGRLEFAGNRTAKTDNNGEFTITALSAGRYAVAAQASSNGNKFSAIGGLGATIFNPAALSASRSTILTLASGDESTVNLRAPRGVRISGAVVGLDEVAVQGRGAMGPGLMLRLVPADSPNPPMGLETARTALRSDGRFQFTGIPAGDYVVRVLQFPDWAHSMPSPLGALLVVVNGRPLPPLPTGPTWWTDVPVTVGTSDLDDLIVPVRKGAGISGTLAFNSAATAIAAEALPEQQLNVMPAEGWSFVSPIQGSIFGNAAGARIEADGHFATVGLPPGRYIFKLSVAQPPRSVTIDGHDAVNGVIEVGNGPVGNVALVMGQFPGQLTGQIQDRSGRLVPDAFVYAFPTDSRRWVDFGPGSFRIQEAAVNRHAEYSISLEPGEYYVVTRTVALPETWMRPEVMRPLIPSAETVLIGEGQKMVRNVSVR